MCKYVEQTTNTAAVYIVSVPETCFHNIGIIDFPPAVVLGHSNCVHVIRDAGCVTGSAAGQMNCTDVQ